MSDQYYVYHLGYDRVLRNVVDKFNCRLQFANEELAYAHAAHESMSGKYFALVVDKCGDLHNTRDGKPV